MGLFDGVGDFIKDNPILKPILNLGSNIYGSSQNSSNQDAYLNSLRQAEQNNYDQAKATNDAYQTWLGQSQAAGNASRAASASAAAANEKNRVGAAKKGMKLEKKAYKEIKGLFKPYADTGAELLPVMTGSYKKGVDNLTMLNAFMTDPQKMNQSVPAWETGVPLPDWMKNKRSM